MKKLLLYIALLLSAQLNGQISFTDSDTIRIGEVVISVPKNFDERSGFKKTTIDTAIIEQFRLGSIADALSDIPALSIKSYGSGGSATPSFRGTGASNTRITWNGIPIENPMLGQSDLSIIPAGMTDKIHIYYGSASMASNNGGTGAIISLETKPQWKKRTHVLLSPGAGSFEKYSGLLNVSSGTENLQSITKAFFRTAENNFSYLNKYTGTEPVIETRSNSQVKESGFMQELYYKNLKSELSARLWYESAARNLPSSMISQSEGEHQSDESLRTMLNFSSDRSGIKYGITGAWIMNRLDYVNPTASIDSRNQANQFTLKAVVNKKLLNILDLNMSLTEVLNYVNTNNYDKSKNRSTSDVMLSANFSNSGRLSGNLLLREILDMNKFLIPDFSTGLQFRLSQSSDMFLFANVSRNSRIPSLNDLYWNPGGNPELKNEYSYIMETGYKMDFNVSTSIKADYDFTVFRNIIHDMIQWHPGEYSWWTADNINNARSSGLETAFRIIYKSGKAEALFNAAYSYTRAAQFKDEEGRSWSEQMVYIPVNQASASLRFQYSKLYASWNSGMTGIRYITADNTKYLPAYILNNASCGFRKSIGNVKIDINLEIDNVFGIDYQTIAYYPLPGRTWFVKLLFESNK